MIKVIEKNGSGKSYLVSKLCENGFNRVVSFTTRAKRIGEENGVDYFFVSQDEFKNLINQDFFVEYKMHNGNFYGTPKQSVNLKSIIISGDVSKFKEFFDDEIITVFINASYAERYRRVLQRNDKTRNLFVRFHGENFSYLTNFKSVIVDNENLDNSSLNYLLSIFNNSGRLKDRSILTDNYDFIHKEIQDFRFESLHESDDKLLLLLQYEDYLVKNLVLKYDISSPVMLKECIDEYNAEMSKFIKKFNIPHVKKDDAIFVKVDDELIKVNFEIGKVEKQLGEI